MTQKLTTHQAEWLIEKIKDARIDGKLPETLEHPLTWFRAVETIINRCTEKPFPLFDRHMDDCAVDISLYCEHYIKIYLEQREPAFTFENFKIFAKACQDIVVWIEENK